MTILTSIILIVAIIGVAAAIAYNVQKGTKTLEEMRSNYYENEEVQEVVELATELYNKDLRPVAPRKTIKKEVTSQDIEKVVTTAKIVPQQATIEFEAIVEAPKKKKGHRYNRKPKTQTPTT